MSLETPEFLEALEKPLSFLYCQKLNVSRVRQSRKQHICPVLQCALPGLSSPDDILVYIQFRSGRLLSPRRGAAVNTALWLTEGSGCGQQCVHTHACVRMVQESMTGTGVGSVLGRGFSSLQASKAPTHYVKRNRVLGGGVTFSLGGSALNMEEGELDSDGGHLFAASRWMHNFLVSSFLKWQAHILSTALYMWGI